ncbi:MAG TPA: 3-hydroxyacyl-ACP dehydratase FabZ [Magnetospirillaceae bacterium]|nr:3-hydroxyacyl-ACP dehydratase FabZ [Magnetospirillaceae bacterium]
MIRRSADTREEVETFLPHRDPFRFVDSVLIDGETIRGRKLWTGSEFFFPGHFPGHPVVPGVILLETMAQCGGVGVKLMGIVPAGTFFFATMDGIRFRRPVYPGDTLEMEIVNLRASSRAVKQQGRGLVGGTLAVEASWLCLVGVEGGPS